MPCIDRFDGPHAFLSNFYPSPVTWDGITFPTVEHAFQAAKCVEREDQLAIAAAATPGKAKKLGKKAWMRENWQDERLGVMEALLCQKFDNEELAQRLLETGGADLVEGNTWGDRFWGVDGGEGKNHLGRLLMRIRTELRVERQVPMDDQALVDLAQRFHVDVEDLRRLRARRNPIPRTWIRWLHDSYHPPQLASTAKTPEERQQLRDWLKKAPSERKWPPPHTRDLQSDEPAGEAGLAAENPE
ncbi:MAG: NADAR family protein [Candidatus Xenobia bacterium]